MAKSKEYEAKTTQEALDLAVADSGIPLSELKFEIVSQGGGGIFGLSLKKARIKVFLPQDGAGDQKPAEKAQQPDEDKPAKPKSRSRRGRSRSGSRSKSDQPAKQDQAAQTGQQDQPDNGQAPPPPKKPRSAARPKPPKAEQPTDKPRPTQETSRPEEKPRPQAPPQRNEPAPEPEAPPQPLVQKAEPPAEPTGWAAPSRAVALPPKKLKEIDVDVLTGRKKPGSGKVDIDLRSDGDKRRGGRRPQRRDDRRPPRRDNRSDRRPPRDSRPREDQPPRQERPPREDTPREPMTTVRPIDPDASYTPRVIDPNAPESYDRTAEDETALAKAKEVLKTILDHMVGETEVEASWVEEKIYLDLKGDGSGILIGRKGQTLDALQFVVSKIIDKHSGHHYRIMVDTEGYRGRREDALIQQAENLAGKAVKTGRPARTGPLNPHERRIVHLALMANNQVRTGSQGEGTMKRVVISPSQSRGRR